MNRKTSLLIIVSILPIFLTSCSTLKPKQRHHKSQQAFLEWWVTPHYKTAAFTSYGDWKKIDNSLEYGISSNFLTGNEYIFQVLKWDEYKWYLVLSRNNKKDAWLVQMPQNSWSPLDDNLSYDLSIDTMKYSDVTEAGINFYWCVDVLYPIIEFTTNGPACTSHYLYLWQKDKNIYKFWEKNYD